MLLKWFPWRFMVSRVARAYGFTDPIRWLVRMRGFAHPSEVTEPVELLRAGVLFHARGLINTRAIQNNLDWIWPYWVERQFNPGDDSFIPRAFSFSHINLTHRNWTAVGLPNLPFYPIVDPRGLVTPVHDGWSLDFWLVGPNERWLIPAKLDSATQQLVIGDNLTVTSAFTEDTWRLRTDVSLEVSGSHAECVIRVSATAGADTRLAVVLRPYNPEGISFIDSIRISEDTRQWRVNESADVVFSRAPQKCLLSTYREGDVAHVIEQETAPERHHAECPSSMMSGAALFSLQPSGSPSLEVRVPLLNERTGTLAEVPHPLPAWRQEIAKCSQLRVPDERFQKLYDVAMASTILHSPEEVYPGPYTYKRFWYRDAAFILNALITLGARERTARALALFPHGQLLSGYFRSQEGEWDSNGEVLWIFERFLKLTGESLPQAWRGPVEKGARWIIRKRLARDPQTPHGGLLPPGFSAEHLGPNDYYYWDNFWGVAGLRSAASMLRPSAPDLAREFEAAADDFLETIVASFRFIPERKFKGAVAASPYRRMDAGAVGSIVADYPLQLFPSGDGRMLKTVEYLMAHSSFAGGFFQNMIHSGINAYLTLELAQVLLRAGDLRALDLIDTVARLATPTGQWPEAIHPRTGGGCMGDGQHIWASAEWLLIIRNVFVREEEDKLVVGSGLFPRWLAERETISFGPTLTPFGPVSVRVEPDARDHIKVTLEAAWRGTPPAVEVRVPGFSRIVSATPPDAYVLQKAP